METGGSLGQSSDRAGEGLEPRHGDDDDQPDHDDDRVGPVKCECHGCRALVI